MPSAAFFADGSREGIKAHLVIANGHENVRKSHAYIARTLPVIARHFYSISNEQSQIKHWEIAQIRSIAREIEFLAPACDDDDARRDNSEYPWEGPNGEVFTPCDYNFPNIDDGSRSIIRLIKLIRTAAETYSG